VVSPVSISIHSLLPSDLNTAAWLRDGPETQLLLVVSVALVAALPRRDHVCLVDAEAWHGVEVTSLHRAAPICRVV